MIFFKPTSSPNNKNIVDFEAFENELLGGKCTLVINGTKAEIISLSCDENKPHLTEGLIKSAFNYACLKNCYMGYIKIREFSSLLDSMEFQKENGVYFNDIPTILQGNCCKK